MVPWARKDAERQKLGNEAASFHQGTQGTDCRKLPNMPVSMTLEDLEKWKKVGMMFKGTFWKRILYMLGRAAQSSCTEPGHTVLGSNFLGEWQAQLHETQMPCLIPAVFHSPRDKLIQRKEIDDNVPGWFFMGLTLTWSHQTETGHIKPREKCESQVSTWEESHNILTPFC